MEKIDIVKVDLGCLNRMLDKLDSVKINNNFPIEEISSNLSFMHNKGNINEVNENIQKIIQNHEKLKSNISLTIRIYRKHLEELDDTFRLFDQTKYSDWQYDNTTVNSGGCSIASYANMLRFLYGDYFSSSEEYAKFIYDSCRSVNGNVTHDNVNLLKIIDDLNRKVGLTNNVFYNDNGEKGRGDPTLAAKKAMDSLASGQNNEVMIYYKANDINTAFKRKDAISDIINSYGEDVDVEVIFRGLSSKGSLFSSTYGHYIALREQTRDGKKYLIVDDSVPKTEDEYKNKWRETHQSNYIPLNDNIKYERVNIDGNTYDRVIISEDDFKKANMSQYTGFSGSETLIIVRKKDDDLKNIDGNTYEEKLNNIW